MLTIIQVFERANEHQESKHYAKLPIQLIYPIRPLFYRKSITAVRHFGTCFPLNRRLLPKKHLAFQFSFCIIVIRYIRLKLITLIMWPMYLPLMQLSVFKNTSLSLLSPIGLYLALNLSNLWKVFLSCNGYGNIF